MRKTLFLLMMAVFGIVQTVSAINGLWLEKKDGTLVGYVFDQGLNIGYNLNSVVMTTYYATVEYPFDDIKRIYFEDEVTEVASVSSTERQSQISLATDGVCLTGFAPSTPVWVYDASGRVVVRSAINADGSLLVNVRQLPKGVYIIKAERSVIKIKNN